MSVTRCKEDNHVLWHDKGSRNVCEVITESRHICDVITLNIHICDAVEEARVVYAVRKETSLVFDVTEENGHVCGAIKATGHVCDTSPEARHLWWSVNRSQACLGHNIHGEYVCDAVTQTLLRTFLLAKQLHDVSAVQRYRSGGCLWYNAWHDRNWCVTSCEFVTRSQAYLVIHDRFGGFSYWAEGGGRERVGAWRLLCLTTKFMAWRVLMKQSLCWWLKERAFYRFPFFWF